MIISPPFLVAVASEDTDQRPDTSLAMLGQLAGTGTFPVSHEFGWHGGIHLKAPAASATTVHPVRAIADGTVIFARSSKPMPKLAAPGGQREKDALQASLGAEPLYYYTGWTSNGVVILKHDTEIGEGVAVTFYSIYQHMDVLVHGVATGAKVYRKDALGTAGSIYGRANEIHLEIVADLANVQALMGRQNGLQNNADGRTNCVWGDMHVVVPAGAAIYEEDPSQATTHYVLRTFNLALNSTNDRLRDVLTLFDTTGPKLRAMNPSYRDGRNVHLDISTDTDQLWFEKRIGLYIVPGERNPAPTTEAQRTLNVPALYGTTAPTLPPGIPTTGPEAWRAPVPKALEATATPLIVSLSEERGKITVTTRDLKGNSMGTSEPPEDGYNLYDTATKHYPGCPSAGYELLRFGRLLGSDQLAESDKHQGLVPHFRKISYTGADGENVTGFIDLNSEGVTVYSDADFPDWRGWTFVNDDTDANSRCDSQQLLNLIDPLSIDPNLVAAAISIVHGTEDVADAVSTLGNAVAAAAPEAAAADKAAARHTRLLRANDLLAQEDVRKKLSFAVVSMPTEWSDADFDKRWDWLKGADPADKPDFILNPIHLNSELYEQFRKHHAALAFWDQAKAAGLTLEETHVHFHPTGFIETFRKCGWLSHNEMIQLFPMTAMRKEHIKETATVAAHDRWVSERVGIRLATIELYRLDLNKTCRRYGIGTPLRMAAFYANAMVETQWFSKLYESNSSARYAPWDGRGFMQLTWPANYLQYWHFIGRTVDSNVAAQLVAAGKQADSTHNNAPLQALEPHLPAAMSDWRTDLAAPDKHYATDSAGAYWAWSRAAKDADTAPANIRATEVVGAVAMPYYTSAGAGNVAATINVGHPATHYSSVNAIVARFQAYATCQVVLLDTPVFPDTTGANKSTPDDYVARRP